MSIGLMSDIHGNRHALEAVVADAASLGVERWWVLGDLVAIGPEPVAAIELIAGLPQVEVVRGNTERYVLTDDRPPPHPADVLANPDLLPLYSTIQRSFAWTGGALAAHGWLDWLRALPLDVRIELPDGTVALGVHAARSSSTTAYSRSTRFIASRRYLRRVAPTGQPRRPTDRVARGPPARLPCLGFPLTCVDVTERDIKRGPKLLLKVSPAGSQVDALARLERKEDGLLFR